MRLEVEVGVGGWGWGWGWRLGLEIRAGGNVEKLCVKNRVISLVVCKLMHGNTADGAWFGTRRQDLPVDLAHAGCGPGRPQ